DREFRLRVPGGSPLVGKTLEELNLRDTSGANVIAVDRKRRFSRQLIRPTAKTELQADDVLLIDQFQPTSDIEEIQKRFGLEVLPLTGAYFSARSQEIGMAEVIVPADSDLAGQTVVESQFRSGFGLTVIGLRRGPRPAQGGILREKLRVGDTLLVVGEWKAI